MGEWSNFFLAQVGASAALTGLIFVGVSVNLTRILEYAALPDRALEAIIVLVQVLLVSSLVLVPQQPHELLGVELLVVGGATWATVVYLGVRTLRATDRQYRGPQLIHLVLTQVATLPFLVAGVLFLVGNTGGLYWLMPGTLFSYGVAVFNAWILLIEIQR